MKKTTMRGKNNEPVYLDDHVGEHGGVENKHDEDGEQQPEELRVPLLERTEPQKSRNVHTIQDTKCRSYKVRR